MHSIYCIENTFNGKYYIGSAVNYSKRINNHKSDLRCNRHPNRKLQNSYNKHGLEWFRFFILEEVDDSNSLIEREQYYIDNLKPEYNLAPRAGSQLGLVLSAESKLKISKNNGRFWKGKKLPKWIVDKMGKPHSEKSKLKMSEYAKNRSETHKINLGKALGKTVIQFNKNGDVVAEYYSVLEAARMTGVCESSIRKVCFGQRNHAGGFYWKYK